MIAERSPRLWRVYHETYDICVIPAAGNDPGARSEWWYRHRDHSVRPGFATLLEPGEVHVTRRVNGPADFWVLQVAPSVIARLAAELDLSSPPHLALAQSDAPDLMASFERFYRSFREVAGPLEQQTVLADCLRLLLEHAGERKPKPVPDALHPAVRRARDYIHAHVGDPVTLEEMVSVTGLTRFHLVRSFNRAYGLPPHAYQIQLRLSAVREALRTGQRLAEVEAGFADQSHLGRHFKRALGVSPGKYVAALAGSLHGANEPRGGLLPPRARTF